MKLLAPNGKPSNLTPEQYRLVRTPAFKAWFGDWENSPETSSKIVDENGEPLVVYHGSTDKFNVFKKEKTRFNYFYFSVKKDYADNFGKSKQFFLNCRKIKDVKILGTKKIRPPKLFKALGFKSTQDGYYKIGYEFSDKNEKFWYYLRDSDSLYDILRFNNYDCVNFFEDFNEENKINETEVYAVIKSNSIKLADGSNTTFDGSNPDIRFDDGGDLKINFDTLEEYEKWITDKIQEQGKEVFIKSEEYRVAYPRYRKLWNEKHKKVAQKKVVRNKIGFIARAFDKKGNVSMDLHDPIEEKFTSFTQGNIRAKELAKNIFKKYKKVDEIIFDFIPLDINGEVAYDDHIPRTINYNRDNIRFDNGGLITTDNIKVEGLSHYQKTKKSGEFYKIFAQKIINDNEHELWWIYFTIKDGKKTLGHIRYRYENIEKDVYNEKKISLSDLPKSLLDIYNKYGRNNPDIRFADGGGIDLCNKLYKEHHEVWDKLDIIEKEICETTCDKFSKEIVSMWDSELKEHFNEEETGLFIDASNDSNKNIIDGLINEHKQIIELINKIKLSNKSEDIIRFCEIMKKHIQKEEKLMSEISSDPYKDGGNVDNADYKYYLILKNDSPIFKTKISTKDYDTDRDMSDMLDKLADMDYTLKNITEKEYKDFDYSKVNKEDLTEFTKSWAYLKRGGEVRSSNKIVFKRKRLPREDIYEFAKMVKQKYPKVWDKGGNIFGNKAFVNLERVLKRGYWLPNEEWMQIKWQSYIARHHKDFRIEGVVAMLKWVATVDKGWAYMKKLINEEIEKKYPKVDDKYKNGGELDGQCSVGTEVQSLLFSKEQFSSEDAKEWAKSHGYKYDSVDEKEETYRLRQENPSKFAKHLFRTIEFKKGLKAVIACPKN